MRPRFYRIRSLMLAAGLALSQPLAALAQGHEFPPACDGPAQGAWAHHGGPESHFGHGPGEGAPPFLHGAKLNDAQQDKVFALLHAQAPQARQLARSAFKADSELRQLGISSQYDETKAKALAEASAKAHAELALLQARTAHQLYALLTPDQKKKLEESRSRLPQTQPPRDGQERDEQGDGHRR